MFSLLQQYRAACSCSAKPNRNNSDGTLKKKDTAASARVGRPSSSLHLWDAENMALLGTLLFPCLALTKDLANAAAAFSVHSPNGVTARAPVNPSEQPPPQPHGETRDQNHGGGGGGNVAASAAVIPGVAKGTAVTTSSSTPLPPSEKGTTQPPPSSSSSSSSPRKTAPPVPQQQQQHPAAMVRAGTGLSRPALVTALIFLSPYPLLVGTSTGGAVVVWRTSDCVCVQVRRHACRYSANPSDFKFLLLDVALKSRKNIAQVTP